MTCASFGPGHLAVADHPRRRLADVGNHEDRGLAGIHGFLDRPVL